MDIDKIIYKSLVHEASEEESRQLAIWRELSHKNEEIYQQLVHHWTGEHQRIQQIKAATWKELDQAFQNEPEVKQSEVYIHRPKRQVDYLSWAAAITFFLVALGTLTFTIDFGDNQIVKEATVEIVEKMSLPGQRISFRLSDGSSVKLNAGSKLTFPSRFDKDVREVQLQGEAFFEVVENKAHPFIVRSGDVSIEVKGTAFNVNSEAYNKAYVAVESGLVEVRSTQDKILVNPGEMAVLQPTTALSKRGFSPNEIAWKEGILIFDKASLEEVKKKIEQWYGVNLTIKRKLHLEEGFTGEYENTTLKTVMQSFTFAVKANYSIDHELKRVVIW